LETCPKWLRDKLTTEPRFALCVAKEPSTPAFILETLVDLQPRLSPALREALVANPNLSTPDLFRLCHNNLRLLLQSPQWPSVLLKNQNILSLLPNWTIADLIRKPQFPHVLLPMLSTGNDASVRREVAAHNKTQVSILHRLAYDRDRRVRLAVANNPSSEPSVLARLFLDRDSLVEASAKAKHPETPVEILCRLAEHKEPEIRQLLLSCPRYPKSHHELLQRAGATVELNFQEPLCRSIGYLSSQEIEALANGALFAKRLIARHPQTPATTLLQLAQYDDLTLNQDLVRRDNLCEAALRRIIEKSYSYEFIHHKNFSKALLALLAESHNWKHREAVAARLDLTMDQLSKLLVDKAPQVQKMALRNLKAPAKQLVTFSTHHNSELRRAVAKHPNTPEKVLASLLGDRAAQVRGAAANNPKTPRALVEAYIRAGATHTFDGINFSLCHKPRLKQRERELLQETFFGRALLEATFSPQIKREARRVFIKQSYRGSLKKTEKKERKQFGVKRK
jgi:hypothetical protein